MSIDDNDHRCIPRFGEEDVLPALREAFSQRPEWREFSPRQLTAVLFLRGYLSAPPADFDVEAASPFAIEAREDAA